MTSAVPPFPEPRIRNATRRRLTQVAGAGLVMLAAAVPFRASVADDDFPSRPVTIILPQPPGGAADRLMRTIAAALESKWGQSVIVMNRPGGGAVVGTLATARSAPDGYTIGLTSSSLSINAALERDLPYDGMKDLDPLIRLGYYSLGIVAASDFPADTVADLVKMVKEEPGKIMYGSNGAFTAAHVAGEMLNKLAGIEMPHVPYNGAAGMYNDIRGGTLRLGFSVVSSAIPFIQSGDMKVLGMTSAQRSPLFPDWPAISESVPGYETLSWAGFVVPAGTPEDRKQKLAKDLLEVLARPEVRQAMDAMGFELSPQGPEEFAEFVRAETERYRGMAKEIGASLN